MNDETAKFHIKQVEKKNYYYKIETGKMAINDYVDKKTGQRSTRKLREGERKRESGKNWTRSRLQR